MRLEKRTKTDDTPIVTVVSDSLIMQKNLANGRSIPLIIINTTGYPQINRAIDLHSGSDQGEVTLTWGKTPDSKYIVLVIESISPVEIKYTIAFELYEHYALLETILKTHLVYVQAGKQGDKLMHNFNEPKILIELPITNFEPEILRLTQKAKIKRFKNLKVKRKDLKNTIKEFDNEWESFISTRLK